MSKLDEAIQQILELELMDLQRISEIRLVFSQLQNLSDFRVGDRFFETFGFGNAIGMIDKPYERFKAYELLLDILAADHRAKYTEIHKGTPFYFLAWTAFDMGSFEKGVYYMTNALSEDKTNRPNEWENAPGTFALLLDHDRGGPMARVISRLRAEIFNSFNPYSFPKEKLADKFFKLINKLLKSKFKTDITILTAFYGFIFEHKDRIKLMDLRGKESGSIEPFLLHLFKGALIYESLLKYFYPEYKDKKWDTIGKILNNSTFKKDFRIRGKDINTTERKKLSNIISLARRTSLRSSVEVTAKLRNTAGHNLIWDDSFDLEKFEILYSHILRSIYSLILLKVS